MRNRKVFMFLLFVFLVVLAVSISTYKISVNYNNKAGNIEGFGRYLDGSDVTLVAKPKEGYEFSRWVENGMQVTTVNSYHFKADKNRELVAEFDRIKYRVRADLNKRDAGQIQGAGTYNFGEEVIVEVKTNETHKFISWQNTPENAEIDGNTIKFKITSDVNLKAITEKVKVDWGKYLIKDNIKDTLYGVSVGDKDCYINEIGEIAIKSSESWNGYHSYNKSITIENPWILRAYNIVLFFNKKGDLLSEIPGGMIEFDPYSGEGYLSTYSNEYGVLTYEGGQYGFVNYEGNKIINSEYDVNRLILNKHFPRPIIFNKDGRFGAFDTKTGDILIDFEFQELEWTSRSNGIIYGLKDDTYYLFDDKGEVIDVLDDNIELYRKENNDRVSIYKKNNLYGLINLETGGLLTDPIYENVEDYSINNNCVGVQKDGLWGVVGADGKYILKPEYDEVLTNYNGDTDSEIYYHKGLEMGYIDRDGEVIISGEFDSLRNFGTYMTYEMDGKIGIIIDGEIVEENKYDSHSDTAFYGSCDPALHLRIEGYPKFKKNDHWAVYSVNEKRFITDFLYEDNFILNYDRIPQMETLIKGQEGEGLLNVKNGEFIIEPGTYDNFDYLKNGLAKVWKNDKVGYVNKEGEIVIEILYDEIRRQSNGMLLAKKKELYGYLDEKGNNIIKFSYDKINYLGNKFLAKKDDKYILIDENEDILVEFKYDEVKDIGLDNIFLAKNDNMYILVDQDGNVLREFE